MPAAAKPWKGATSPKTPGERKRKEPEGPAPFVPAHKAYVNEHKEEYKKKHPDKESKDINKELKAAYEALSVELKQPYEEAAAKDKQRYTEEMKAVRARATGFVVSFSAACDGANTAWLSLSEKRADAGGPRNRG